jgi:hypothetical protein
MQTVLVVLAILFWLVAGFYVLVLATMSSVVLQELIIVVSAGFGTLFLVLARMITYAERQTKAAEHSAARLDAMHRTLLDQGA